MKRKNLFVSVYNKCNTSTNREKYDTLYGSVGKSCPNYIDIELTNYCNFKCLMCPVGTKTMKREQGFMNMDIIEKICKELKSTDIEGVRLIRWGEPTLHKEFLNIIEMLKATGKMVHFNTNGSLLNETELQKIIDLQVDSIKFSFQGVDEYTYGEMRGNGQFHELIRRIKLLNQLRGEEEKPFIQVSTTTTYETEEQIKKFEEEIVQYVDYCNVGRTKLCHLDVDDMKVSEQRKEEFKELLKHEKVVKKHIKVCPEVFDKLSINWDGTVSACCADYNNMMVVGNLRENTLQEIFNNDKMKKIREIIREDRYDDIKLCKTCYSVIT